MEMEDRKAPTAVKKKKKKKKNKKKKKKKKKKNNKDVDEAREAETLLSEILKRKASRSGKGGSASSASVPDDLASMVLGKKRSNPLDGIIASMEQKYGAGGSKKKGKKGTKKGKKGGEHDIDEEEFLNLQKKMFKGKAK